MWTPSLLGEILHFVKNRLLKTPFQVSKHPSSFTAEFLIKSCRFPSQTALSIAQSLRLNESDKQKYESVITFLRSHGFSDSHLVKVITKRTEILQSRVAENMEPKFQYLIGKGFAGSLLPVLISTNTYILGRSLTSHIKPSIDFLRMYLHTDAEVVASVMRSARLLTCDFKATLQQNIEFLIAERVSMDNIAKMLLKQPRMLLVNPNRLCSTTNSIKNLNIEPHSALFPDLLKVMVSVSLSVWNKKLGLLKGLGWSEEDIRRVLKSDPRCIACSEEKIKHGMGFYVNTLKLEPEFIISNPRFLKCSMNKRVVPRYCVFKLLESLKLEKLDRKFVWVIMQTEESFVKNYVNKYCEQVPNLMKFYRSSFIK